MTNAGCCEHSYELLGSHKSRGISWLAEELLACQEEVWTAELLIRQAQGRGTVFVFR